MTICNPESYTLHAVSLGDSQTCMQQALMNDPNVICYRR